jgi:secondary thiamine-phosphate synthase enzyme
MTKGRIMEKLTIQTTQSLEFQEITQKVGRALDSLNVMTGALMVYVPHTTAGITINENADPSVEHDVLMDLRRIMPVAQEYYKHFEGNSAAHTLTSLVGSSVLIPVHKGKLSLGRWQGIFFCEFDGPRTRSVLIQGLTS